MHNMDFVSLSLSEALNRCGAHRSSPAALLGKIVVHAKFVLTFFFFNKVGW